MSSRKAPAGKSRVRTESMIDRLGKKPASEGFDLLDKDYVLGALRLFQCKLEVAPPFEKALCFDAVGEILEILEDVGEGAANYGEASKSYSMINKPRLSELMNAKLTGCEKGTEAGLAAVDALLKPFDGLSVEDAKGKAAKEAASLSREYLYRSDCQLKLENAKDALTAADRAVAFCTDRKHMPLLARARALLALEQFEEAAQSANDALKLRNLSVVGLQALADAYRGLGKHADVVEALRAAHKIHRTAAFLRDIAFALSEQSDVAGGLKELDAGIADPPHEEGEDADDAKVLLLKAKAAVLADEGDFAGATAAVQQALKVCDDEECVRMEASLREAAKEAGVDIATAAPSDDDAAKKIQALQRGRQARREAEGKKEVKSKQIAEAKAADVAAEAADNKVAPSAAPPAAPPAQEAGYVHEVVPRATDPVFDVSGVAHREDDLIGVFKQIDKNGNGWLDPPELQAYYQSLDHFGLEPDPTFVDRQLKEFGGDGKVTFDEFAVIMCRLAAR